MSAPVLASIAHTATPQGAIAVARAPRWDFDALEGGDLVVVLAEVADPGNAGTLVRTASAAGASGVVFVRGSVDPWHPKVVRSAAAELFRIPVVRDADPGACAGAVRTLGLALVGAAARAPVDVYDCDLTRPVAIVVGNEAWGLPGWAQDAVDELVAIPMPGGAESLNVAVAGAILLFEAVRQRRLSSRP